LSRERKLLEALFIGWRFCRLWYLPMEYHIVKWVLTMQCSPPGKVMILFRNVP
jgi:hypothetical protein